MPKKNYNNRGQVTPEAVDETSKPMTLASIFDDDLQEDSTDREYDLAIELKIGEIQTDILPLLAIELMNFETKLDPLLEMLVDLRKKYHLDFLTLRIGDV